MPTPTNVRRLSTIFDSARLVAATGLLAALAGCATDPLSEDELRRAVSDAAPREAADASRLPEVRQTTRSPGVDRLGINPSFMPELERMAGPGAYQGQEIPIDENLMGEKTRVLRVNLQRALRTAAENNLALQFSRLSPAIGESEVVAAQAAFDWTYTSGLTWNDQDEPRVASSLNRSANATQEQTTTWNNGLRKQLASGAQLQVQQELIYRDDDSPGQSAVPDRGYQSGVTLQLDQPLLRGAGSEVALAEVRLAQNAEREKVAALKRDMIRTLTDVEKTYWSLVRAERDLRILQKHLERGMEVQRQVRERAQLDATPAQIADATARVEQRRADVIRARTALRQTSDRFKGLINDPEVPVGSEVLLVAADDPVDAPFQFSLLESIQSAIENRPELDQAILSIDDTAIRKVVADNARLPKLDLRLQSKWTALDAGADSAVEDTFGGDFVNYVVGLAFEQPIGNRRAEADFRRRSLERQQAVLSYKNTVQQVMLEVKSSLQSLTTQYQLIEQTRASRVAASEVLRAFLVEKDTKAAYTVERLDLELSHQERLAQAEREEVIALTDYHNALADYYSATGRTLERNSIIFDAPTASQRRAIESMRRPIVPAPVEVRPGEMEGTPSEDSLIVEPGDSLVPPGASDARPETAEDRPVAEPVAEPVPDSPPGEPAPEDAPKESAR
ncbi:MAG: TolC family protein [Phycisphaerae bacterium]|nr:TolC family protein [Phycisphaerae bacterium]